LIAVIGITILFFISSAIDITQLTVFICTALVAGALATFLTFKLSKMAANTISKINYRKLCISIIAFISIMALMFSQLYGLLVLIASSSVGIIPPLVTVKRSHAMGCLLLPVIKFFVM